MDGRVLHMVVLSGAFWTALLGFAARSEWRPSGVRYVLGLLVGGVAAHLGWALFHAPMVFRYPLALLDPALGFTVLAFPIGHLLTAPRSAGPAACGRYLAACFGSLPLALAVARLGCLVSGCCHGVPTRLPWGVSPHGSPLPVHPTPLYEASAWVALFFAVRRLPEARVASVVLIAFGAIRLAVEPLRAAPPLGQPLVPPALVAALWIPVGLALSRWPAIGVSARPSARSGIARKCPK